MSSLTSPRQSGDIQYDFSGWHITQSWKRCLRSHDMSFTHPVRGWPWRGSELHYLWLWGGSLTCLNADDTKIRIPLLMIGIMPLPGQLARLESRPRSRTESGLGVGITNMKSNDSRLKTFLLAFRIHTRFPVRGHGWYHNMAVPHCVCSLFCWIFQSSSAFFLFLNFLVSIQILLLHSAAPSFSCSWQSLGQSWGFLLSM